MFIPSLIWTYYDYASGARSLRSCKNVVRTSVHMSDFWLEFAFSSISLAVKFQQSPIFNIWIHLDVCYTSISKLGHCDLYFLLHWLWLNFAFRSISVEIQVFQSSTFICGYILMSVVNCSQNYITVTYFFCFIELG